MKKFKNIWPLVDFSKIKDYLFKHKVFSLILLLAIIFVGYKIYVYVTNTNGQTRYLVATVERGTILQTVSGTGQVSASGQIDLKPKVSGEIVYVGAKSGDFVSAGTLIAQIDARDAMIGLENARISLAKLIKPADKLSVLQAQNTLASAREAKDKAYVDGFNYVDSAFLDLPRVINGLNNLINNSNASPYFSDIGLIQNPTARSYRQVAINSFARANDAYNKNLIAQRSINRSSASSSIEALIEETSQTARLTAQALKDANAAVSFIVSQTDTKNQTSAMTTDLANINSWTSQITSDVSNLSSIDATIDNANRTIADKQETLIKLKEGADILDVQAQELAVRQKEYAYADYFIRAPADGIVQVSVKKGDTVSGSIGTFVTKQKIATVSLNEVDIAKVRVGQKATLSFDAVDDLTISGQVVEADIVGTVSQGVVSYNVKIAFDTQDDRIRSGMSVSADIVTDIKQDVLVVPSGAIKTEGLLSYVEVVDKSVAATTGNQGIILAVLPKTQEVTIGLTDDTSTEVKSGLSVGDKVISKAIAGTSAAKTTTSSSLFGGARTSGTRSGVAGIPLH